jgi:hypothetical protein
MTDLWASLVPLIIGSALVPVQIIITILLLRSQAGKLTAVAFVGGMTAVRLVQGVLFGLVLSSSDAAGSTDSGPGTVSSVLLFVVGVLFWVMAVKKIANVPDEDAPPPRWLTMTESMGPAKAFGLGALILAIGAKFWAFTLLAISTIGDADLGQPNATITYLLYVVLAEAIHVVVIAFAVVAPTRSAITLDKASMWLEAHTRHIMIGLGSVFGTWFLFKGLAGLGVI